MKHTFQLSIIALFIAFNLTGHAQAVIKSQPSPANVQATNSNFTPSQSILERNVHYQVNSDATVDVQSSFKLKINDQQGVDSGSQIPQEYNPNYETLDIIEAYTLKADGRKVFVTPDKIINSQALSSADAPMFNQNKVKTVVFADTSIGDTLVLLQKLHRKPILDRQVNIIELISPVLEVFQTRYTITAPKSINLKIDSQGFNAQHQSDKQSEIWQFTLDSHPAQVPEPYSAYTLDKLSYIFASNLNNYNEVAKSYYTNHIAKANVTPEIQQKADVITKGIDPSDKLAQATAIYNWVSSNIRYVAVYLGNGSLVPHQASEVLINRYGDCKDHVVLLEALLSAKGIESVPVLIGINNSFYDIPKIATMPGIFDHVITYIPQFDKYVDSTIGLAPFGTLAGVEIGKPALLTHDKQGQGKLITLPMQLQQNQVNEIINVELLPDGNAKGTNQANYQGNAEIIARQRLLGVKPSFSPQIIKKYLQSTNQMGEGTISFSEPKDLTKPFATNTHFQLTDIYDNEESSAFVLPLGIGANLGITPKMLNSWTTTSQRKSEMTLPNTTFNSTWYYQLPSNIKVIRIPKNVDFSNDIAHYKVTYEHKDNQIIVTRILVFKWQQPTIPASNYGAVQELNKQIQRDFKRPVVYDLVKNIKSLKI